MYAVSEALCLIKGWPINGELMNVRERDWLIVYSKQVINFQILNEPDFPREL